MTSIAVTTASRVISGFHQYNEVQQHLFSDWKEKLRGIYEKHGFAEFHPRPAELSSDLKSTGGISNQIYSISRMNDRDSLTDIALPYDRTVPLALWINQHMHTTVFPFKRYDIGVSWRGEHAQAGRFRAFYQADVDIIGPGGLLADVECIATLYNGLKALGFTKFQICINNIGIIKAMIASLGLNEANTKQALTEVDKLDKTEASVIAARITALDAKLDPVAVKELVYLCNYRGPVEGFTIKDKWKEAAEKPFQDLNHVFNYLEEMGLERNKLVFSPGMVRGLDYYTGTVFETFLDGDASKYGSVASGGRYDKLVEGLGDGRAPNREMTGVGGSIGLTRLFDVYMRTVNPELVRRSPAEVCVVYRTDAQRLKATKIATKLRDEGKKVDLLALGDEKKMKDKLSYVNAKGIPYAIIVFGENIGVKNMKTTEQVEYKSVDAAIDGFLNSKVPGKSS